MKQIFKEPWFNPVIIGIIIICCVTGAYVQNLPAETAAKITSEDGPFELASAIFYALALIFSAVQLVRQPGALRFSGTVMLLWATLRELDFQKRFTYRSVESIGYYSRPIAPWSEKIIVLLVLLPFAIAGMFLVYNYLKRVPVAVRAREKWVGYSFGAIGLMALSSFLEKILRFGSAEEVCESGVALLVLLLVIETRSRIKPSSPAGAETRARFFHLLDVTG